MKLSDRVRVTVEIGTTTVVVEAVPGVVARRSSEPSMAQVLAEAVTSWELAGSFPVEFSLEDIEQLPPQFVERVFDELMDQDLALVSDLARSSRAGG
jgi:hypothetical protein